MRTRLFAKSCKQFWIALLNSPLLLERAFFLRHCPSAAGPWPTLQESPHWGPKDSIDAIWRWKLHFVPSPSLLEARGLVCAAQDLLGESSRCRSIRKLDNLQA